MKIFQRWLFSFAQKFLTFLKYTVWPAEIAPTVHRKIGLFPIGKVIFCQKTTLLKDQNMKFVRASILTWGLWLAHFVAVAHFEGALRQARRLRRERSERPSDARETVSHCQTVLCFRLSELRAFDVCCTCSDGETRRRRGSLAAQGYLLSLFSFSSSSQKGLAAWLKLIAEGVSQEAERKGRRIWRHSPLDTGTVVTGGAKWGNVCRKIETGSCGAEWTDSDWAKRNRRSKAMYGKVPQLSHFHVRLENWV